MKKEKANIYSSGKNNKKIKNKKKKNDSIECDIYRSNKLV